MNILNILYKASACQVKAILRKEMNFSIRTGNYTTTVSFPSANSKDCKRSANCTG